MPVKKTETTKKIVSTKTEKVEAAVSKAPVGTVKVAPKAAASRKSGLSVPSYSLLGKVAGELDLPKEIFGAEVNTSILKQAVRVYETNTKNHWAHTKTRGDVNGSTRKIYKQKGTGRARHGANTAPIFVGGGIALGPRARRVTLDLPEKMRKVALVSALSSKMGDKKILGVSGLEKASGKTKELANLIKKTEVKSTLLVVGDKMESVKRASKNLQGLDFINANVLNAYEVIKHQNLMLTSEAVEKLKERLVK